MRGLGTHSVCNTESSQVFLEYLSYLILLEMYPSPPAKFFFFSKRLYTYLLKSRIHQLHC